MIAESCRLKVAGSLEAEGWLHACTLHVLIEGWIEVEALKAEAAGWL